MRKNLFVMIIIMGFLVFSLNCCSKIKYDSIEKSMFNYENELIKRMEILEEKVQPELDSGVTMHMGNATRELYEAWENELNTVYSLLMEKLPKDKKIKLENEQKIWLKNREAIAKKVSKEAEGGTMESLLFGISIKDSNEKRAIELAKKYDKLMNNK